MAQIITHTKHIDASKITYDEVKKNSLGGNIVYIKYDDKPKLTIQTEEVSAPFGLSTYTDDKTGNVKYSLDISFRGMDENPKVKLFHDKMAAIDEALLDEGVKHSKEWFGKKMTKEVVENFYRPLVKPSKDPSKYAPTMKIKIQTDRNGEIACECYDHQRRRVDITEALQPGCKVQALLEANSVWFVGKNMFGISWRLIQLKIQKSDKIAGFAFMEDSDDDGDGDEVEYEEEEVESS